MNPISLEDRVTRLEQMVNTIITPSSEDSTKPARNAWRKTIGAFEGDDIMSEIIEETLKIREDDRKESRS